VIELDRKVNDVFAGKVVRKDLVRKVKVGANVPVHVLEYLIGKLLAMVRLTMRRPTSIAAGSSVAQYFIGPTKPTRPSTTSRTAARPPL
jgi:ATP-dependent Lon protease